SMVRVACSISCSWSSSAPSTLRRYDARMKTYRQFQIVPLLSLLALLAVILQSCTGPSDDKSNTFQKQQTGNGSQIGINKQAVFKGKIYFTLSRNLYVMDGQRNLTPLTQGMDVRDPAVSPDG